MFSKTNNFIDNVYQLYIIRHMNVRYPCLFISCNHFLTPQSKKCGIGGGGRLLDANTKEFVITLMGTYVNDALTCDLRTPGVASILGSY